MNAQQEERLLELLEEQNKAQKEQNDYLNSINYQLDQLIIMTRERL